MSATIYHLDDYRPPKYVDLKALLERKHWTHICPKAGLTTMPAGTVCGFCQREERKAQ